MFLGWSVHHGLSEQLGKNVGVFDLMFEFGAAFESPAVLIASIGVLGTLILNAVKTFRRRNGDK